MFENMSPREKKLALFVGAMLPIVVLFLAFFWFMDRFDSNNEQIDDLMAQVQEQEDKTRLGLAASKRQGFYRKTSLPRTLGRTRNVYSAWLDEVVLEDCGMTYKAVRSKKGGNLVYERDSIASRNAFTIRPIGTLEQLTKFLHIFYSAEHMHRINKLSIKPDSKSTRGKPAVLTGELRMEIEIEVLSMSDGPDDIASFPVWKKELPMLDRYADNILTRNIFGPANNKPSFDKPRGIKFTHVETESAAAGKFETVLLSVKDADKDDMLSFELVEKSGQEDFGIELGEQPRTASTRRISLRVPKQFKRTRIPVTVRVVDDGLPAKSDEIDLMVAFDPPTKKTEEKKDPPKLMAEAAMTNVIGLMRGTDKRWVARIHLPTKLRSEEFGEGDSITVDGKKWKVVEVTKDYVTFEIAGERKSFRVESNLSQPLKL